MQALTDRLASATLWRRSDANGLQQQLQQAVQLGVSAGASAREVVKGLEQQLEEAHERISAYENKLEGMAGSKQALKVSSLALMRGVV